MELKPEAIYLKLGGSLITDKRGLRSARMDVIRRLAEEIHSALSERPDLPLIIGHGSGSFGHVSAHQHKTRDGVRTAEEWEGFVEVWHDANDLNHLVMRVLRETDLPVIRYSPNSLVVSKRRELDGIFASTVIESLTNRLVPVVYGDVIFDRTIGGTIYSTEEVFMALAEHIHPIRILIAGIESGVYSDYPECQDLIPDITPMNYPALSRILMPSETIDVTGGMATKVKSMLDAIEKYAGLSIGIFSGAEPGNVRSALLGGSPGTSIHA